MCAAIPLTTLLSRAWVALTIETDNAFEAVSSDRVGRCVRISLPMWTNGLRHLDDDGVTVDLLRARARAGCNIGGLERWGWLSIGDPHTDNGVGGRRQGYGSHRGVTGETVLRPTAAGRYARRAWPRVVEGVEKRWRGRFGGIEVDALREALRAHPSAADTLPWSPPEVNPVDGFRTSIVALDATGTADPVGIADSSGTAKKDLPLAALLGRALTGLTLELERGAAVSLPLAANVLRVVAGGTVRIRELPALSGISKEAVEMALTYLRGHRLATTTPDRTVELTHLGLDALEGCHTRATQPVGVELRGALQDVLAQTAALSAAFAPPAGCWRAANPYLAQTRRLIDDPTGSLPWQPMVLHRAGWPDGN